MMKVEDSIRENKEYWKQLVESNKRQALKHKEEMEKFEAAANEAQIQIQFYDNIEKALPGLNPIKKPKSPKEPWVKSDATK